MHYFDSYSNRSKLRNMHPSSKMAFFTIFTVMALISQSILISSLILVSSMLATVFTARVSLFKLIRLMVIPLLFLITGVFAVSIETKTNEAVFQLLIFNTPFCVSKIGATKAVHLFMRSISSISVLYFLILNTPINDIIYQLRQLKVPSIILEITTLIYHNIFVLMGCANAIHRSQKSRLGYRNLSVSMRSLGQLGGRTFVLANTRANHLYRSMESRCYTGEIQMAPRVWKLNKGFVAMATLLAIFVSVLLVINKLS